MQSRRCSKCKQNLPLTEFCVDRTRPFGRAYVCRDCKSKRVSSGPTLVERQRMATLGLKWCARCERWQPSNLVRACVCKPCRRAYDRERYANDPIYRIERQRHSMVKARGVEPVPQIGREHLLDLFDGSCAYCQRPADTWDHIEPVSKGGQTVPGNIVPACVRCNSSKKDRHVDDFVMSLDTEPHPALFEVIAQGAM